MTTAIVTAATATIARIVSIIFMCLAGPGDLARPLLVCGYFGTAATPPLRTVVLWYTRGLSQETIPPEISMAFCQP